MAEAPIIPPLLLTPREAATALAISERTLWTLTKSGALPAVRLGRSVRYSVDALREHIAQLQSPQTPAASRSHRLTAES
jgi:excisionase family DNA binding protein